MMKRIMAILVACMVATSFCACSNNGDSSSSNVSDSSVAETQTVERSNLGITMALGAEYASCVVNDLSENDIKAIADGAVGGFSIVKSTDNGDVVLANIVVIPNSMIDTPEKRSGFPYIFAGSNFSVAAKLPMLDTSSASYDELSNMQSGIMNQLATLFFDEMALEQNIGFIRDESGAEESNNESSSEVTSSESASSESASSESASSEGTSSDEVTSEATSSEVTPSNTNSDSVANDEVATNESSSTVNN